MIRFFLYAILLITPVFGFCRKNEVSVHFKNGLLLNKSALSISGSTQFTKVKNTFTQVIGIQYTRILNSGLLLSGGADIGYERYNAKVNYPFNDYGFEKPSELSDAYTLKTIVPYTEININVGYRFKKKGIFYPEIRLGQYLHLPHGYKLLQGYSYETAFSGFPDINFETWGQYGKTDKGSFAGELINGLYLGTMISKKKSTYHFGIELRQQLIFNSNPFNTFRIKYFDTAGNIRSFEEFRGKHLSINFVLGYTF